MVPKKWREKYQFQYRKLFFDRVFPDREKFEAQIPFQPGHSNVLTLEEVEHFLASSLKNDSGHLLVIYTTDPYLESRGQRSTWLTREFVRRGYPGRLLLLAVGSQRGHRQIRRPPGVCSSH